MLLRAKGLPTRVCLLLSFRPDVVSVVLRWFTAVGSYLLREGYWGSTPVTPPPSLPHARPNAWLLSWFIMPLLLSYQVGVPKSIALNLTVPELVTAFNVEEMAQLVARGPLEHPGARCGVRPLEHDAR